MSDGRSLATRIKRLEEAGKARTMKGAPLAAFARAVDVIISGDHVAAVAAVKAIPRQALRLFARGILGRIDAARSLADEDEIEDIE